VSEISHDHQTDIPDIADSYHASFVQSPSWQRRRQLLGCYVVGQSVTLLVVIAAALFRHDNVAGIWAEWDGEHFLLIARSGYVPVLVHGVNTTTAFFPGYPAAIRLVSTMTWLRPADAAVAVSVVSGLIAALGLTRLCELVTAAGGSEANWVVWLMATGPLSVLFVMAYSEAMFIALAAWCLVALVTRRWLLAGVLAALAGTVRQTAVALVLAVVVAVIADRRNRADRSAKLAALAFAPMGVVAVISAIAIRTGRLDGWFQAERAGWNTRFDFGRATARFTGSTLTHHVSITPLSTLVAVVLALVTTAVASMRRQLPAPVLVYCAAVIVLDVGTSGLMNSKVRLLLPVAPLVIPWCRWLSERPKSLQVAIAIAAAILGTSYSAYRLLIYPYAL
jgi:hypothetical protein